MAVNEARRHNTTPQVDGVCPSFPDKAHNPIGSSAKVRYVRSGNDHAVVLFVDKTGARSALGVEETRIHKDGLRRHVVHNSVRK